MPRPFVMYPDKRLRTVASPIDAVTDQTRALWDEMLGAMYAMPGVGLAANQIGVLQRVIVLDCSDHRDQPLRLANPEILHASTQMREHEEGSPNLPGHWARVSRPRAVTVRFLNDRGDEEERDFVGLWATSVQHQVDHLNGRLFIDHLSPVKRRMIVAKHQKAMKRGHG
ncbi:peptide deformylase [Oceanibium sediminis]|uniref:peptide deformylase n=1 Tax=Oceanibium sediminis TaxID=2026339 RepID=UPI000DD34A7C|nr:peptide deformylase [Oceanibium sediminis]